ncbi:MAG TPA: MOSC domain-containing protein, partial [Candidatus Sulfotelmatobacter sp.]|nr:MOSC domain-containing protein [Candidatus Sulfotelmatobacter sp.]
MRLVSIQVGKPVTLGQADAANPDDRSWTTGFFKASVTGPVYVGKTNLEGDGQADLKNHGGVDKAICAYSKDHWAYWETEFSLHLANGAFGENFTIEGATERDVCIGDIYRCGGALLQVSQPRQPCWKLARRWR